MARTVDQESEGFLAVNWFLFHVSWTETRTLDLDQDKFKKYLCSGNHDEAQIGASGSFKRSID